MNINYYQPSWPFDDLRREFNRALGFNGWHGRVTERPFNAGWVPSVDIKEEEDRFVLFVDVPGIDLKDIEITFEKGVLTIKGERAAPSNEELKKYLRLERQKRSFERRFRLPETVNPERINARGENGVLEITIAKAPVDVARKIVVK